MAKLSHSCRNYARSRRVGVGSPIRLGVRRCNAYVLSAFARSERTFSFACVREMCARARIRQCISTGYATVNYEHPSSVYCVYPVDKSVMYIFRCILRCYDRNTVHPVFRWNVRPQKSVKPCTAPSRACCPHFVAARTAPTKYKPRPPTGFDRRAGGSHTLHECNICEQNRFLPLHVRAVFECARYGTHYIFERA